MATPRVSLESCAPRAQKHPLAGIVVVMLLRAQFIWFLPLIGRDHQAQAAIRTSLNPTSSFNLAEQRRTNDEGYRFQCAAKQPIGSGEEK